MSDTPRTDMEIRQVENLFDSPESIDCKLAIKLAAVDFARQLERELADKDRKLAEARAEIERKDKLIEQMREAIKFSLIADEVRQTRNVCASDINDACETSKAKIRAALSAAERINK